VKLISIDTPELLQLVAGWLAQKENYQWLDAGDGRQLRSPEWLKVATQRGTHVLRLFTSDVDDAPIGVVGLGSINRIFKTAAIWVVLGDKRYARQGYATRAFARMLTLGFAQLGLHAISTWTVEHNPSIHVVLRNGFRPIGRQRQCHYIDGRACDRLLFDLLATEHHESDMPDIPGHSLEQSPSEASERTLQSREIGSTQ
jgi:RimJ/RimL family protein N-acetyltransferase